MTTIIQEMTLSATLVCREVSASRALLQEAGCMGEPECSSSEEGEEADSSAVSLAGGVRRLLRRLQTEGTLRAKVA